MPPKIPTLTLEEKKNLHVRWFIDSNQHLHVLTNETDEEYEDLGKIASGVHLLRLNQKGEKMDCALWKMVSGTEMLLMWPSGNFHTAEAHIRFGNWGEPANLGKQWGNYFFVLAPYDLL